MAAAAAMLRATRGRSHGLARPLNRETINPGAESPSLRASYTGMMSSGGSLICHSPLQRSLRRGCIVANEGGSARENLFQGLPLTEGLDTLLME